MEKDDHRRQTETSYKLTETSRSCKRLSESYTRTFLSSGTTTVSRKEKSPDPGSGYSIKGVRFSVSVPTSSCEIDSRLKVETCLEGGSDTNVWASIIPSTSDIFEEGIVTLIKRKTVKFRNHGLIVNKYILVKTILLTELKQKTYLGLTMC